MRFFTVHEGPGEASADGTHLVPEGFSWLAFLLPMIWLPLKALWIQAFILVSFYILIVSLGDALLPEAATALFLAASLLTGLEGRNWQRHRLSLLGFKEAGIVGGADLLDAETRWFARRPPASPPKAAAAIPSLLPWPGQTA